MRVLIAGGGTGGHLYPGIALARELRRRHPHVQLTFVGAASGVEARVVPREGFTLRLIRVSGLKGKSRLQRLQGLALLPLAALDAWRVLSQLHPDVVVGVGGFASGPVLLLAALRGRPTMLLEQNALPGLTNRLLARVVRTAAVTFAEALSYFPGTGVVTGNPVRGEFFAASSAPPSSTLAVLVFGGSQGAHAINMAMASSAPRLADSGVAWRITHQTGERDVATVTDAYVAAGVPARVESFLYEIDQEMTAADVVVARAGATTLSELAAAGKPAILIPLPTATDDHQRRNAEVIAHAGGAEVLEEHDLTGDTLANRLLQLAADPARRARMAAAMRTLARPDAAARIADLVDALAGTAA